MTEEIPISADKMEEIMRAQAWRFYHKNKGAIPFDDLYEASRDGLVPALKYWTPDKGAPFDSFLAIYTRRRLLNYVGKHFDRHCNQEYYIAEDETDDSAHQIHSFVKRESPYVNEDRLIEYKRLLDSSNMTGRWIDVLSKRYKGVGLKEIAQEYGVTQQTISYIYQSAINKLRAAYIKEEVRVSG